MNVNSQFLKKAEHLHEHDIHCTYTVYSKSQLSIIWIRYFGSFGSIFRNKCMFTTTVHTMH